MITADNVYDYEAPGPGVAGTLASSMEVFNSTIEQEDYLMGETTQRAVESGTVKHLIFGRNEPALHHYHNSFREALNLPPLERLEV